MQDHGHGGLFRPLALEPVGGGRPPRGARWAPDPFELWPRAQHLGRVARHQLGTKFLRINAEKAPFFVEKLAVRSLVARTGGCTPTRTLALTPRPRLPPRRRPQIRTLPTVVLFKNGVAEDRLVGFNEVGGDDSFKTRRVRAAGQRGLGHG